jgi:GT2 family glycosyltransferase
MTGPITVIIPAYGPGPHLEEVVDSLDGQLDDDSRIIISHSGGGDPTKRFASNSRVTVLHSRDRLFAGAARNKGLIIADTEWVAFVDEDVVPAPDWYAAVSRSIEAQSADCIVGSIGYKTSGGYWGISLWFLEFGPCHPYLGRREIKGGGSCNMIVRREFFTRMGGFPEQWRFAQDTVAHARMNASGHTLVFEPSIVVLHHNPHHMSHMFRHMYGHGRYSALVRRQYGDLPGASAVRWPILSLGMWPARTVQITRRVMTARKSPKIQFLLHLPGILGGLAAWSLGFANEALRPKLKPSDVGG